MPAPEVHTTWTSAGNEWETPKAQHCILETLSLPSFPLQWAQECWEPPWAVVGARNTVAVSHERWRVLHKTWLLAGRVAFNYQICLHGFPQSEQHLLSLLRAQTWRQCLSPQRWRFVVGWPRPQCPFSSLGLSFIICEMEVTSLPTPHFTDLATWDSSALILFYFLK